MQVAMPATVPDASPRFLFVDKPSGIVTHATQAGPHAPEGFVEYLSRLSEQTLYVCHRLDKGTSGAMTFATSAEAAAQLSEILKARQANKTYLFLTDRMIEKSEFSVESRIEKRGSRFVSEPAQGASDGLAITHFRRLKTHGPYSLWEARPETGRPHQIRLHAEASGIALLGDDEHGGTPFPTLALHAQELSFESAGERYSHSSPPPTFFEDLALLDRPRLCAWLASVDRRRRWLTSRDQALQFSSQDRESTPPPLSTWRWIHTDGLELRAEQLGSIVDLQWFESEPPNESDWDDLHALTRLCGWHQWRLHLRRDRGRNPNEQSTWASSSELPETWTGEENGLRFEFRSNQGLSSGLFLDQRANRGWVRKTARGKKVLNLFCYTGGFSVAAAAGGAERTVSVDLSRNFLEWSRRNFALNDLEPATHEFRAMEAREFIKYATKKELRYDLIICDPPSFGRSEKGVFRIEKELRPLIVSLAPLLSTGGQLLVSCNYEGWNELRFAEEVKAAAQVARLRVQSAPRPDWDFELPDEPAILKSALIEKN
ncbi:MAG: class I SAM-dependent methyltransferase [Bdellovibrionaceae bacterium]|nr:class I SAM-dependent methyltransferase [Pseudobdellovibrionaceae bacterium]